MVLQCQDKLNEYHCSDESEWNLSCFLHWDENWYACFPQRGNKSRENKDDAWVKRISKLNLNPAAETLENDFRGGNQSVHTPPWLHYQGESSAVFT